MPSDLVLEVNLKIREAMQRAGLTEPRHEQMFQAVVVGMYEWFPVWVVGVGAKSPAEMMDGAVKKIDCVVRAVKILDEATPLTTKMTPELN